MTPQESPEYRYTLSRIITTPSVRPRKRVLWVMLNPSTATDTKDDATIRKCIGFSQRWYCTFMSVVNLYAARSTDPKGLKKMADPVGPENDKTIVHEAAHTDLIVLAWGNLPTYAKRRGRAVLWLLKPWVTHTLGITKAGFPRHPSRAPYSTELRVLHE
jgi:hypothetical protein